MGGIGRLPRALVKRMTPEEYAAYRRESQRENAKKRWAERRAAGEKPEINTTTPRACLKCGRTFDSLSIANRICSRCSDRNSVFWIRSIKDHSKG